MRVGFVGPSPSTKEFSEAAELLLSKLEVDYIVYLGIDDPSDMNQDPPLTLDEIAAIAKIGSAEEIRVVSAQYKERKRRNRIHRIPDPPARSIEMVDDRIVLFLYNKAHLDEDDVFNATLIVYGNAPKLLLNKFGHRIFFCPGPLSKGHVGLLSTEEDGPCTLQVLDMNANVLMSETLQGRVAKMSVS